MIHSAFCSLLSWVYGHSWHRLLSKLYCGPHWVDASKFYVSVHPPKWVLNLYHDLYIYTHPAIVMFCLLSLVAIWGIKIVESTKHGYFCKILIINTFGCIIYHLLLEHHASKLAPPSGPYISLLTLMMINVLIIIPVFMCWCFTAACQLSIYSFPLLHKV